MSDTNLPWRIFGRAIRPYALAVSVATAVIAVACLQHVAVGKLLDGVAGDILGWVAALTAAALWVGWVAGSDRIMRAGLLWSAGVWGAVTTVLLVDGVVWVNWALAAPWVIASGGAWLIEQSANRER